MLATDLAALGAAKKKQLANWWAELNAWGWPQELGEPEPNNRDQRFKMTDRNPRRIEIMRWIESEIGTGPGQEAWRKKYGAKTRAGRQRTPRAGTVGAESR